MKSLLIRAVGVIAPNYLWRLRAKKWTGGQADEDEKELQPAGAGHPVINFIFVQPAHLTRLRNHNWSV